MGGVVSPILANLYLNDFDQALERAGLKLVRYADDFVILCRTVNEATAALKRVQELLAASGLELAPHKTRIATWSQGFDFLGYHFRKLRGKNYQWPRIKAIRAFKDTVKKKTRRQQPKNIERVVRELNPVIRGWGNYFRRGDVAHRFAELDGWIRMRLRSFTEKKKWPSGMNWRYPNDHFKRLGLVSLTELRAYQSRLSSS